MTELIFELLADYGVTIVFIVTFLSCLAIPIPSSLLMLASGGFAATGDLSLISVGLGAFGGAVLGDNSGYWIARKFGTRLDDWLARHPKRAALRARSAAFMEKRGGSSVFFSCWLVAPLGPYMNYFCGITRYNWLRFALWGIAGEIVWVSLYVGLGHTFADNISGIASLLGNASGFVTALVVVIALGIWLIRASKKKHAP
ncbi:MAG TPA: DedA family protein [Octadecabacter sp.]|nr:DedA family protein [Octadecabacter sp.]